MVEETRTQSKGPLLAATDCGETSIHGLLVARDLAQQLGVKLILVHVIDERIEYLVPETQHRMLLDTHRAAALTRMQELVEKHLEGVDLDVEIETGEPISTILEVARRRNAQMIVVGSRGHGRLSSAILGSTVQGLLHAADRPVLAVPNGAL